MSNFCIGNKTELDACIEAKHLHLSFGRSALLRMPCSSCISVHSVLSSLFRSIDPYIEDVETVPDPCYFESFLTCCLICTESTERSSMDSGNGCLRLPLSAYCCISSSVPYCPVSSSSLLAKTFATSIPGTRMARWQESGECVMPGRRCGGGQYTGPFYHASL
jgi:hypothetical protein